MAYGERLVTDLGPTLTRIEAVSTSLPKTTPDVVAAAINELLPMASPLPTEERT